MYHGKTHKQKKHNEQAPLKDDIYMGDTGGASRLHGSSIVPS